MIVNFDVVPAARIPDEGSITKGVSTSWMRS